MSYRKHPIGTTTTDIGHIDDGWAIIRNGEDALAADTLAAVTDTEAMADKLLAALNTPIANHKGEVLNAVKALHGSTQSMGWTDMETAEATKLLPRIIDTLESRTVQIITRSEGGNHEPVFVTTDYVKAKAEYLELIKAEDHKLAASDSITDIEIADGIERGTCGDDPCVRIDGVWYRNADSYGDTTVLWFVEELE